MRLERGQKVDPCGTPKKTAKNKIGRCILTLPYFFGCSFYILHKIQNLIFPSLKTTYLYEDLQ